MRHKYLKDVTTIKLDKDKCIGCRMCTKVCPHAVFIMEDKKSKIIHKDYCMECGACVQNCPANALDVKIGVGCAAAVLVGWLKGTEPTCG